MLQGNHNIVGGKLGPVGSGATVAAACKILTGSHIQVLAVLEKWVPYSQRYLFNAIPDTNHNANPTKYNPTWWIASRQPAADTGSGPLSQRSAIANVQGGLDWIQTIFFF